MRRLSLALLLSLAPAAARSQPALMPSDAAPYARKLDLSAGDHELLLVPGAGQRLTGRPLAFRFLTPALEQLLLAPGTVRYVSTRNGGVLLQILHLRARDVPPEVLGPQKFEVLGGDDTVVGRGELLVVTDLPQAIDATTEEGGRTLEEGRPTPLKLRVRANGNWRTGGDVRVVNGADVELGPVRDAGPDSAGVVTLEADVRPLHRDANKVVLGVETLDGRTAELTFPRLAVRPAVRTRLRAAGAAIYLDGFGYGTARLTIGDLAAPNGVTPEVSAESAGGELTVREQRYARETRTLEAWLEFSARSPRSAGTREARDVTVRAGGREHLARVEIVDAPVISVVRTEPGIGGAVVTIADKPTVVRVVGLDLDALALDCTPLGARAKCRTVASTPNELVTEVTPDPDVEEGDLVLPLVATGPRTRPAGLLFPGGGVRLKTQRPSVPLALETPGLLALRCPPAAGACRPGRDGVSLVVKQNDARNVTLSLSDSLLDAANGWQRLAVTVTRVRGDRRDVVRTLGSAALPRLYRRGLGAPALALLDPSVDIRHGDAFVVRVEHALDQYAPAQRAGAAGAETWVRTVYVDGGLKRRFSGDVSVQPVLYSLEPDSAAGHQLAARYMNAGIGATWQPMDWRMQPRAVSAKMQLIAMSLVGSNDDRSRQPALFFSGNIRVPGSDPSRPIMLTAGMARLVGGNGDTGWRFLAGAGVDLGLAGLTLGR
jgi:hypothetical protein